APCDQTDQSDEVLMPPPTNYHRHSATLRSSRSPSADHFVAPQHRISPQSGNSPRNHPGNSPRNHPGNSPRNHPGNSPRNHPGNSPRNPPDKSPSTNPGKSPRPRCSSPQVNFTNVLDMNKIKQL
uniref:Uncharacterized protein n=1 Tax=Ciona savignyi TaxID=51511 RepID=H2Y8V7_CIOSA